MIIDCHCHAGEGDGFTGPWDTSAPLDKYLVRARRAGIDRTVVFSAFHSDYAVANRRVAELVAAHPDRLIGFAFVNPRGDQGQVAALLGTAVRRYGFRGIKVHQHDGRITREVCEAARRLRLPILYDVMGETATVDLVAGAFPDVTFIVPHLGSFGDDYRAQLATIDLLVRFPNVYADTSGVRASTCWSRRSGARAPRRSCSAPTAPGCIRRSRSRRFTRSACVPWRRARCWAATSCVCSAPNARSRPSRAWRR